MQTKVDEMPSLNWWEKKKEMPIKIDLYIPSQSLFQKKMKDISKQKPCEYIVGKSHSKIY